MRLLDAGNGIRFGLYVFIFLIVFCLAQLTWWIIFQIDLNSQLYQYRMDLLALKISSITSRVNNDFQRSAELADYVFRISGDDRAKLEQCLANLTSSRVVIGYHLDADRFGPAVNEGRIDSTFHFQFAPGMVLYFDSQYPQSLIGTGPPDVIFSARGHNNGEQMIWVRAEMFEVSPDVRDRIERESHRGSKMFIFEGSFFMVIVLFGAYLIYRTLQRSEDLKVRQANFIQSVTHEFRTPLTSLRLYIETLQSGRIETPQAQKLYGNMLDDCDRLDSMVDNVLEAGQFGREEYALKLSETDLTNDLKEYLNGLKPYIGRQNATLQTDLQDDVRVRSDYQALGRAVRALVDNAMKYSPADRRFILITLATVKKDAVLTIADRGIGIPVEEQKKIFDRFYRIGDDSSRTVKGTGLGLYLVRHIIEAHGGTVEVTSEGSDRGSRFIIKLPLVKS